MFCLSVWQESWSFGLLVWFSCWWPFNYSADVFYFGDFYGSIPLQHINFYLLTKIEYRRQIAISDTPQSQLLNRFLPHSCHGLMLVKWLFPKCWLRDSDFFHYIISPPWIQRVSVQWETGCERHSRHSPASTLKEHTFLQLRFHWPDNSKRGQNIVGTWISKSIHGVSFLPIAQWDGPWLCLLLRFRPLLSPYIPWWRIPFSHSQLLLLSPSLRGSS